MFAIVFKYFSGVSTLYTMGIEGEWKRLRTILTCWGFNPPQSLSIPMDLKQNEH
jgi:hypothetical protein